MSQTIINARISDQTIQLSNLGLIASGIKDALQISCEFDSLWTGYGKTAVFYRNEDEVYHIALVNNIATVPHEVLAEEGCFCFGIMGSADNIRTTEVVRLNVAQGAITTATAEPEDPTPDIYQQLLAVCGRTEVALAVERARIDQLVAMRGSNGVTQYEIQDDVISGTIYSNGVNACVEINGVINLADKAIYTYSLPEWLEPLGTTYLYTPMADSVEVYVTNDGNVLGIKNVSGSAIDMLVTALDCYDLANISISEMTGIRVGYDGTIYPTADEAVREQISRLHNEKNTIGVDLANYAPAAGNFSTTGEYIDTPINRVVSQDLIPVKKGDIITAYNGYAFNIVKFDDNGDFIEYGTYGYTEYTVDWDGYLRISLGLQKEIALADYDPAAGTFNTKGEYINADAYGTPILNRVVNQELIPVNKGTKITVSDGYAFNVVKFDSSGNLVEWGTYGYTEYLVDWDGYLRLSIGYAEYEDMTDYVADACANVHISVGVQDMTDYVEDACKCTSITRKLDVNAQIQAIQNKQKENERRKYIFHFPYSLDRLYVCDYESMEDLKGLTPAQYHAKMKALCDTAPGYATQTLLGNDADGNPLYKYVLEPNVPYINCSRNESTNRSFDGTRIDTPTIIVLSGIHGTEASNNYAVYNLLKNLLTNRNEALDFIFRNLRLVIVPAICPSGHLKVMDQSRNELREELDDNTIGWTYGYANSQGININRDFPITQDGTTQSPEAGYVKAVIDSYPDAIALVDMHTHYTYDIMSWNYTDDDVFKYVATRVAGDLTNEWLDKYPDKEFDTVHGSHDPFTKVWVYQAPNVDTTSSTYASKVWGIPAGTIEMRRKMPITNIHHGTDAVAYSYDMLVNFILSFCRTIA